MKISPFILGSGKAAQAIQESLAVVGLIDSDFEILPARKLARNQSLDGLIQGAPNPVLFIANPHALHTEAILAGERAGFSLIVSEKPVAVNQEQIARLRSVRVPVAVCHVYRQMWGIQTLKTIVDSGELGELISIEGRYWQSSAAQKALNPIATPSWKNDPALSGSSDVLLDLATHWADAALFLVGGKVEKAQIWKSFLNAERPHRDTHVQLTIDFSGGPRALASISKTVHGAANHFEVNLIGTRRYASWNFLNPDVVEVAEGAGRSFRSRTDVTFGSRHSPHHGLGWIEGYIEIIHQALLGLAGAKPVSYPTLQQSLHVLEVLLNPLKITKTAD